MCMSDLYKQRKETIERIFVTEKENRASANALTRFSTLGAPLSSLGGFLPF